jgi:hypothetical protein
MCPARAACGENEEAQADPARMTKLIGFSLQVD